MKVLRYSVAIVHPGIQRSRFSTKALITALISVVAGLSLGFLPLGSGLVHASYDVLQLFRTQPGPANIVIVTLDRPADRSAHAQLIRHLTAGNARLIVSDLFLRTARSESEDKELADAIGQSHRVILAGEYEPLLTDPAIAGGAERAPHERFLTNAVGWGLATVLQDEDGVVRRHFAGSEFKESLPWTAALQAGARSAADPTERKSERPRWLNYCGPPQSIPTLAFEDATNQPTDFFVEKFVFIAGRQPTGELGDRKDFFRTPFTRWDGRYSAGVEILATTFLNLMEADWATRSPGWLEAAVYLLAGLALGSLITRARFWGSLAWAMAGGIFVFVAALFMFGQTRMWFPWMVVALAQIPTAFICALALHSIPAGRKDLTAANTGFPPQAAPAIPDHVLLRKIGQGSYGEVWLARNAVGMYRAVKIVYRDRFEDDGPYEREFRGIEKFMPVSLSHPGLLNILHVGRKNEAGCFYYIMEAGDDENTGTKIQSDRYRAKTLAEELNRRGPLPANEILQLMLHLTDALRFLHERGLVHRDIKPANIIYTDGKPKLADIGLVSEIAGAGEEATIIGTKGYLLSESAGTVAADLYALGKVLYVALTGLKPEQFPELPDAFEEHPHFPLRAELGEIAWRACGMEAKHCYQSVTEMRVALLALQEGGSPN